MRVAFIIGLVLITAAGTAVGGTAHQLAAGPTTLLTRSSLTGSSRNGRIKNTPHRKSTALPDPPAAGGPRAAEGRGGAGGRASPVTSYPRMVAELHSDARHSPWVRLAVIGKSHRGRALWLVRVADPGGPPPMHTTRLLVLCRQHGDEPASTEAMLDLLHRVMDGRYRVPEGVTLYLVPMVNPDGAARNTRLNGIGADLNRDWGVFSQPETRAVAHAAGLIRPQVVVDAHNWDTTDSYNANCLEVSRDGHSSVARATLAMQSASLTALRDAGYSVAATTYGRDADPHLAHRWFAHKGLISCLVETHSGSPTDTADFTRRQCVYVALIQALARRYAGKHAALDALEGVGPASVREAALFPPLPARPLWANREGARPRRSPLRLWALLAYGMALFAAFISRGGGCAPPRTAPPLLKRRGMTHTS